MSVSYGPSPATLPRAGVTATVLLCRQKLGARELPHLGEEVPGDWHRRGLQSDLLDFNLCPCPEPSRCPSPGGRGRDPTLGATQSCGKACWHYRA